MSLRTGTCLGPYEIQAALGAGGMGEVYRARDSKLNRDVALKVLPDLFAADPDRLARFKREAQVLASLNHPNIAAIYGLEECDGIKALVMELVEGPTLADRIGAPGPRDAAPDAAPGLRAPVGRVPPSTGDRSRGGPAGLPIEEALAIAQQIAEALEAAHEQNIIHRDLKPANIKVRSDGVVKVLDFGLAKALDPVSAMSDLSQSPTITSPAMTRAGVVLGTATYMAPEQARGRAVDKRADIWAFGCVVFEMLTGTRAFDGEDIAETLGAVIHKEPAWSALPADTPPYLRTLLRRCLQKDPKKRLPHIGIARIEIDEGPAADAVVPTPAGTAQPPRGLWRNARIAWLVTGVTVAAAIALAVVISSPREAVDARVTRATILLPPGVTWTTTVPGNRISVSPDGLKLAFIGTDGGGPRLWVRPMDAVTAQPLAGTEGAGVVKWSPDGRSLLFVAGGRLRRIEAAGGPAITLADKASTYGLAWGAADAILFLPEMRGPLYRVPASGGASAQVTTLDTTSGDSGHWHPVFLPDGRHFLYVAAGNTSNPDAARAVYVGSLDQSEEPRLLLQGGSNAQYASGYLMFLRESTLMVQPFDPDRLELSGEAVPLVEQIRIGGTTDRMGAFAVSDTGTLVYQTGLSEIRSQLAWFDRTGKQVSTLGEPADQMSVELSPDGTRVLVSLLDPARRARDLWIYDGRRGLRSRFTFDPGDEATGTWSADGSQVLFNARRSGSFDLYRKASSGAGSEELLVSDDQDKFHPSWKADGRVVVYNNLPGTGGLSSQDLWTVPLTADPEPAILLRTEFSELRPRFSPDGRWIAYESNESGRTEIYVTSFPDRSGKWQVSTAGGTFSRWRRDGKELFYLSPDSTLMATTVDGEGSAFQVGAVQPLFQIQPRLVGFLGYIGYVYDVSADGQRFLINTLLEDSAVDPLTLLVNWPALLRR